MSRWNPDYTQLIQVWMLSPRLIYWAMEINTGFATFCLVFSKIYSDFELLNEKGENLIFKYISLSGLQLENSEEREKSFCESWARRGILDVLLVGPHCKFLTQEVIINRSSKWH